MLAARPKRVPAAYSSYMSQDTPGASEIELHVPATANAGTRLKYLFVNNSAREVLTGSAFGLDVEGTDGWERVNLRMIFTAEGTVIRPGQSREINDPLPDDLPAGTYRLRKD